jgi:hypothetical protein
VFSSIHFSTGASFVDIDCALEVLVEIELTDPAKTGREALVLKVKDLVSPTPSALTAKIEIVYVISGSKLRILPFHPLEKAP